MSSVRNAGVISILCVGYFWFLAGIAWAPDNKLYQQGLVVSFWVPALVGAVLQRKRLLAVWQANHAFLGLLLVFLAWAAVSATWTSAESPFKEVKRVLYVCLFLLGFLLLALERQALLWNGLCFAFVSLALSCPLSFYLFYVHDTNPLSARLLGIGEAGHPILGAYVMALAAIWGLQFFPRTIGRRLLWSLPMVALLLFVVLGQSRGAMLALGIAALTMPLWSRGRFVWLVSLFTCAIAVVGLVLFLPLILLRGLSYRPEIFVSSVEMIMQHPWLGQGIGADYRVVTPNFPDGFDHSHNAFTHSAILLGLPGLLLWSGLWLISFRLAWVERETREGRLVLSTLLVSFVASQFDAASLWGSPRAEWFVTWLPIGLSLALAVRRSSPKPMPAPSEA